jgi:putative membrane-bound dehydrogenase-like protein
VPDVAARRLEILFLGHESQHHNSGLYAPMLQAALAKDGINFSYTTDPADLNPRNLAQFDGLIVYANHNAIAPEQEKALLDFVASGKGFLPIHSASYMFRNSDAYIELVGALFKEHGTGDFTADILDPDHPVLDGIEPFETWDETYIHERHNEDRTVLMERVEGDHREPWTWVRTHGKGRVFYTAYGHDQRTWGHPSFQRLIRNAIFWAVGEEAAAKVERLAIDELGFVTPEVPVPNYERRDPAPLFQLPLSAEASMKHMQVPPGFELQLFASEPDIVNPIAMAWDERGRLWVVESMDYPNNKQPDGEGSDVIKILEDTDGDGRADKFTIFADKLSIPTGLAFANGGVIVAQAPDFLFLKDTDGDDRADVREVLHTGWRIYDTHAGPSNLKYGLDNMIWGAVGYAGFTGTIGEEERAFRMGVYRMPADGQDIEIISNFTNNTWGLGFDETFDIFGSTANNEHSVFVAIPNRYYEGVEGLPGNGRKKLDGHYAIRPNSPNVRQVDSQGGFTAVAGHNLYTARSYPQEYWNRVALVNEPTAFLLHRAILEPRGSGYAEVDGWNLVASSDEWVSPIHAEVGPDGAVWFVDWYNFIIQHNPTPAGFETGKGAAYETPLREQRYGRIYRLVWKGAKPYKPISLSIDRPKELVQTLRHDNMFWRTHAQRLLVERGQTDVLKDLYKIVADRKVDQVGLNSPAVHALWTIHGLGALDGANPEAVAVAQRALNHPAAGVRKTALRVLLKTSESLAAILSAGSLTDENLNTRLAAFLALSELPPSEEAGRALYEVSKRADVVEDEWLPEALYIAAVRHAAGFFDAHAADVGAAEFASLATRAARGDLGEFPDWSVPTLSEDDWGTAQVPAVRGRGAPQMGPFTGIAWYRREINLPANAAGKVAKLHLARPGNADITYINGTRVGATDNMQTVRQYDIPAGLLKAGSNVIAIRAESRGRGGVFGQPDSVFIAGSGFKVPLAGEWKHKVEETWEANQRRTFSGAIPLAQQLLKHYNPMEMVLAKGSDNDGAAIADDDANVVALTLGVIPGVNRFDKTTLTIKAGQRVRLTFKNTDDMQHNVVITERDSYETVEKQLNEMLSDPNAMSRGFIPESNLILHATPLVDAHQTATLTFTAPTTPGDYPFVCTFPGHWVTMRGILRVEAN